MAAIIRFFSRRFGRRKSEPGHSHLDDIHTVSKTKRSKKSDLDCRVRYLDGTEQTFYLSKHSQASELYDISFAYLAIVEEKDYFGLKYLGKKPIWLDPTKGIRHQCKSKDYQVSIFTQFRGPEIPLCSFAFSANPPYPIALQVKFFASDPHNLRDEYTRYLVVLQLREDIRSGKLSCSDRRLTAELCALLLQAEFGDYDPHQHTPVFVSTFRFLPEQEQTEEFELSVLDEYRSLSNRSLTPADAESLYLQKSSQIPDYGVAMHTVLGKNNQEYRLGLTPTGILVYEGQSRIGLFFWPHILSIEMKRNKLELLVSDEDNATRKVTEHFFRFTLPDKHECKNLWKCAVEYHTFFRRTTRNEPPPKRRQLFRLHSRFQASFNTEYQLHYSNLFGSSSFRRKKNKSSAPSTPNPTSPIVGGDRGIGSLPTSTARTSSFRRIPSKRFASRQTFSSRTSFDERRARRHRVPPPTEPVSANIFDDARAVVTAERACLHDPPLNPPDPRASLASRTPTLRSRPAPPIPTSPSTVPFQPAVRITPDLGIRGPPKQPPKPPRIPKPQTNHANKGDSDTCFEVSV